MRFLISISILFLFAANLQAKEPRLINVSSEGIAKALPDQAEVNITFSAEALEAEDARRVLEKRIKPFINKVKKLSLAENSLDTSQTQIYPKYEYIDRKREPRGFEVSRQISLKLDDLEQLDELITLVSKNQASRLNNINFTLKNAFEVQRKALRRAIKNAKQKAKVIALGFDATLGKIYQVTHHDNPHEQPVMYARTAMAAESSQDQSTYQQKEIEYKTAIQASFLID